MAEKHDDQGRHSLDGHIESAAEVLMRPTSVAVGVVEPQNTGDRIEKNTGLVKKPILRAEAATAKDVATLIPMSDREYDYGAAAWKDLGLPPAERAGRREDQAIRGEFVYAITGLAFGMLLILGGMALAIHGIADGSSWTARLIGLRSAARDTGPGLMLFLLGVFLTWTTRPSVRWKDLRS